MTTEQTQHARDSAELRRLCSERDQLREKVAEQAREIAVLKANVVTDNSMVLVNALAELERLKAQSGAVVQWPDADEIMQMAFEEGQPSEDASGYYFELEEFDLFIQRLMEEVARLNSSPVSAVGVDERCDTCHGQGEVWTGENQSFGYMSMQPPEPIMEACPECSGESASDGRSAFAEYLKDCEVHGLEPDIGGAFHFAWQARAALSAPNHSEQVRPMVPDGWSVEQGCSPSGYVLHSPGGSMIRVCDSGMGGIETAFAMFLKAMLAASPSAGSQEQGE